MDASQLPSSYSHVHFAFGQISSDFNVDLSGYEDQFETFANLTYFKRIISFGGWSFSTSLDSYPIFRQGVTDANRLTFAQNVVAFVEQHNLDGVDFDWEYPGAPDIPGIPPGSATDGPNYLNFLTTLRGLLPSNKTISMAAPASYWYLKGFPIANMSEVLDYIVYMTYDLHGQWDWNNTFVNPGCADGNCLRSHVNLTETEYALAMITKAGVPANKVIVGIASYGRSFGMEDPSCTGPECLFTGPNSTATPGDCTATAGYISQAELSQFTSNSSLSKRAVTSWYDSDSDSDMMTYGENTWVAYMSQDTKASRINLYSSLGFGGAVEWALDLITFVEGVTAAESSLNVTEAEEDFTAALSLSNYNISDFTTYNLSLLATRLLGWNGCTELQKKQIYSGWQQSWKIMNYIQSVAEDGINFNEAAAVEYLGAPGTNKEQRTDFNNIYKQLVTIQPGYIATPLDWRLGIRCDDPRGRCPCDIDTGEIAYTVQKDPKLQITTINFCPRYYKIPTLDTVMQKIKSPLLDEYANMKSYYPNQAVVWFHELLHVDWASTADTGAISHITDIRISYRVQDKNNLREKKTVWYEVYGPFWAKGLARLGINTGLLDHSKLRQYDLIRPGKVRSGEARKHLSASPTSPFTTNGRRLPCGDR